MLRRWYDRAVDVAIWNLFHDGTIEAIRGDVPGDLELDVSIDYLRRMVQPAGELFRVRIRQCTFLELQSWADDSVISDVWTTLANTRRRPGRVWMAALAGTFVVVAVSWRLIGLAVRAGERQAFIAAEMTFIIAATLTVLFAPLLTAAGYALRVFDPLLDYWSHASGSKYVVIQGPRRRRYNRDWASSRQR